MKFRSVIVYSVLRLLAFLVPLALLLLLPIFRQNLWLAAIFAAVIGLALSMLLLRRPLDAVTAGITPRATRRVRIADEDIEDAVTATDDAAEETPSDESPITAPPTESAEESPEQDRRVAE